MQRARGLAFGVLGVATLFFSLVALGILPMSAQAPVPIRTATEVGADSLAFWWAEEEGI